MARAEIGRHKEITVEVDGEATDHLADSLNATWKQVASCGELRNSGWLGFRFEDGRLIGRASVGHDEWDLAIHLRALAELSEAQPKTFRIALEPDGPTLVVKGGKFTTNRARVAEFLERMSPPRPNYEGLFDRLRLVLGLAGNVANRFEDALFATLRSYRNFDETGLRARRVDGSLLVEAGLDGNVFATSSIVHALAEAWLAAEIPEEMDGKLVLEGDVMARMWRITSRASLLSIRQDLRVAKGPYVGPYQRHANRYDDECDDTRDSLDKRPPGEVSRHPELAPLLAGRSLMWVSRNQEVVRLDSDGTLRIVDEPFWTRTADGLFGYHREVGPLVLRDFRAGTEVEFPVGGGFARLYYGFVKRRLLVGDLHVAALGRVKVRYRLFGLDGKAIDGPTVVNASANMLIEESLGRFCVEVDGKKQLITMNLESLQVQNVLPWNKVLSSEHVVRTLDGRLLIIGNERAPGSPTINIVIFEVTEGGIQQLGDGVTATLSGSGVVKLETDAIWVTCQRELLEDSVGQAGTALARFPLDSGEPTYIPRPLGGSIEQVFLAGDELYIQYTRFGVDRVWGTEATPTVIHRCRSHCRSFDVAVSEAGQVAMLNTAKEGTSSVHLVNGQNDTVSMENPLPGLGLCWIAHSALPGG